MLVMHKLHPDETLVFLELIDKSIKNYPERVALSGDVPDLSYRLLDFKANTIMAQLQALGVSSGAVVAIHTEARDLAIASMIAVLRSGCAYLPLDPIYPLERLEYMVANANTRLVIRDNDIAFPSVNLSIDLRSLVFTQSVQPETLVGNNFVTINSVIDPASDAYIIYTSGSTGRPKGVRMNHGVLNNLIQWQNEHYSAKEAYRTLQFSSLSFDVSFQEIFSTFAQGGTLFLVRNQTKQDFRELLHFIEHHRIERIFLPYIALLQLLQWMNRLQIYPQHLQEIITAGEQLVISDDVKRAFRRLANAVLCNQYGPSESHVVTEYVMPQDVDAWMNIPSIGKPITQAQIWLLDENLHPVADGEVGELFIAGPVLANGYINNEEETNKRFIDVNINGSVCKTYRTGDLAQRDNDGNILYKGRIDSQVKISGYRVELSEIEAQLLNTGLIEEAAVAVREKNGNKSLVAFIRTKSTADFSLDNLKAQLAVDLPAYMMPAEYSVVVQLVKTATGKIDRKTMLESLEKNEKSSAITQNSNESIVEKILAILRRVINQPNLQLSDNLHNQGMTSLAANAIVAAVYDELAITVPAYALFQYPSVKHFIDYATKNKNQRIINLKHQKKNQ
jgi:amino acid adenylation domain-containing protein